MYPLHEIIWWIFKCNGGAIIGVETAGKIYNVEKGPSPIASIYGEERRKKERKRRIKKYKCKY